MITDSFIGRSDTSSLTPAASLISASTEQTEKHWNVFYDTAADQIDFPGSPKDRVTENKSQMKPTPTLTRADSKARLSRRQEAKNATRFLFIYLFFSQGRSHILLLKNAKHR